MLFRREQRIGPDASKAEWLEFLGIDPDIVNVRGPGALREATVFACIRILSEAVAKLPLKVYQDSDGIQKATGHYLYSLLKLRPNPYMSTSDWLRCLEVQRNLYGNAYCSIEYYKSGSKRGQVRGLWPMDADKVTVWIDKQGIYSSQNHIWYVVEADGKEFKLHPDEILHVKGLTVDGLVGIPPLEYLRTTIENAAQSAEYINKFFKQGLQSRGIVHYVGDLSPDAEEVFRSKFERMSSGLTNAHRISLMPYGYKFEPIALSLVDAQFLENTQLTIKQIASAFGVKLHQLNELEKSSYASLSEQQRQFYVDTMMAVLTVYEQELSYKLFLSSELDAGYYCKFQVDALTRADIKTRYDAYRTGIQGGFLRPNEVRGWEELPPADGGDMLLVNGNMVPIQDAGAAYKKGGGDD